MVGLSFPLSNFQPIAGLETPAIAALSFAVFCGDGTYNPRDNQNLVGAAMVNDGAGPTLGRNSIITTQVSGSWQTPMADVGQAFSLVFAYFPPASGSFAMPFVWYAPSGAQQSSLNHLWVSGVPTLRVGGGTLSTGSGNVDLPLTAGVWNLIGHVNVVGKPLVSYNLTTGAVAQSPNPVVYAGRPIADGRWHIGSPVVTGYPANNNIGFALGCNSEISQPTMTALAAALRYPLSAREIFV